MIFRKKNKYRDNRRTRVDNSVSKNTSVFSYYASRNNIETTEDRSINKRTKRSISSTLYIILGLIIIISCIYVAIIDSHPRVITFKTSNNDGLLLRDIREYENKAQEIIENNLLNFTKFTINTADIEKKIGDTFAELDNIKVVIPIMGRRPVVQLSASRPVLVLTNQKGSFLVNEQGKAIIKLQDAKNIGNLELPYVNDQTQINLDKGVKVITSSEAQFIDKVFSQIKSKNIEVESITIPPKANEIDIKLVKAPYIIKFNTQLDPNQQAGTLLYVLEQINKQKISVNKNIDLRVEERAYFQ